MSRWACRSVGLAVGLALALALAGVMQSGSEVAAAGQELSTFNGLATPVKVMTLEEYHPEAAPEFSGRVEAGERASLAFRVAGALQALNITMGDQVQQGDVLAELDPTDFQLKLEARAAEFELARLGAERSAKLFAKKLISEDQFDTSQTLMATSKARLEQATEQLSFCRLVSPFNGNIAFTYAMPSEVVAANQPILTLQDTTRLEIHFNLPPQFEPLISGVEKATFKVAFDVLPAEKLQADYKEVNLQPDPDTNSYPMTLSVLRPDNFSPAPGMSVRVSLYHPSLFVRSWVLPGEALFERSGQRAHVWRIDDDNMTVHRAGITLDSTGAVINGLRPGDRIVAAGVNRLSEGQKVRAWIREGGL